MESEVEIGEKILTSSFEKSFLGTFPSKVDSKGRMNIPASFRDIIAAYYRDELAITTSFEDPDGRFLIAFPLPVLAERLERLRKLMAKDESIRSLFEQYAGAVRVLVDSQGRIVIPRSLREGKLSNHLMVVGRLDHFIIWDVSYYEEINSRRKEKIPEVKESLKDSGNFDLII